MENKLEDGTPQKFAKTYLGTFGAFLPLITMIALIFMLSVLGMRSSQNFIAAGFTGAAVGFLTFKDKERYMSAMVNGVRNPTFSVMVLIFFIASVFAQVLAASGLTNSLVLVMEKLHISGGLLPVACFLVGGVMSTASGSSSAVVLTLIPIMLPLAPQLGVNPGLMAAAISSGGIFGDNLAPISDTVIASTQGVGADINRAVREKIKYSVAAGIPCAILFLVLGMKMASSSVTLSATGEGSMLNLVFLCLPVLVIVMILRKANFLVALLTGILAGVIMLFLFGYGSMEMIFGTSGIIVSGISGMTSTVIFMMFIFLVLSLTEEAGALYKLSMFMNSFAKSETSAEAVCGAFMCLTTAVTTSGTSSMGFCGPLIAKILAPYKISPERMSNFIAGLGCGVVNLIPYSGAAVVTVALCAATGAVDVNTFTQFSYIKYNFYPMALLIVYWFAILTGWGRSHVQDTKEK